MLINFTNVYPKKKEPELNCLARKVTKKKVDVPMWTSLPVFENSNAFVVSGFDWVSTAPIITDRCENWLKIIPKAEYDPSLDPVTMNHTSVFL